MNKYEKALQIMCNGCDGFNMACHAYKPLKELIDKVTPKKVNNIRRTHKILHEYSGRCPSCRDFLSSVWNKDYCRSCGQKLDWSKEDE